MQQFFKLTDKSRSMLTNECKGCTKPQMDYNKHLNWYT